MKYKVRHEFGGIVTAVLKESGNSIAIWRPTPETWAEQFGPRYFQHAHKSKVREWARQSATTLAGFQRFIPIGEWPLNVPR